MYVLLQEGCFIWLKEVFVMWQMSLGWKSLQNTVYNLVIYTSFVPLFLVLISSCLFPKGDSIVKDYNVETSTQGKTYRKVIFVFVKIFVFMVVWKKTLVTLYETVMILNNLISLPVMGKMVYYTACQFVIPVGFVLLYHMRGRALKGMHAIHNTFFMPFYLLSSNK